MLLGLIPIFGSTICVKTFSKMKYIKFYYRSALTDEHLQLILMIGNTKSEPQLSSRPVLQKFVLNYYNLNFVNKFKGIMGVCFP